MGFERRNDFFEITVLFNELLVMGSALDLVPTFDKLAHFVKHFKVSELKKNYFCFFFEDKLFLFKSRKIT
jgi:hypothetical protein